MATSRDTTIAGSDAASNQGPENKAPVIGADGISPGTLEINEFRFPAEKC